MKKNQVQSEDLAPYNVRVEDENAIVDKAMAILYSRLKTAGIILSSPDTVKNYLRLHLTALEHEVFVVLFLDVKNRLIAHEEMFRGTLTQTSVYPREVIKTALQHNAASVIFAHNHPSGMPQPSEADLLLTSTLVQALRLVDIRVLDHIIVGGTATHSFAENGQI